MSTKMPRENIYITDDIKSDIEKHSSDLFISKSELCRQAFDFYFSYLGTTEAKAVYNFAEAKHVEPITVVLACIKKQIPPIYWEDDTL